MQEAIDKVNVLMEALPYIRRFRGKSVVIKYGGSVVANEKRKKDIVQDIVFMSFVGIKPFFVHGGGSAISEAMKAMGKESKFINGLRVTDDETLGIARNVLTGINSELVELIRKEGGDAVGFCDGQKRYLKANKVGKNMGHVGEMVEIGGELLNIFQNGNGTIPVIAPVGCGEDGEILNVNADEVAAKIAGNIKAEKFVLITDVSGIMEESEGRSSLISTLRADMVKGLIADGVISGGMVPKVKACVSALGAGVKKAHIIDGNISHALLLEIFTDKGIGTEIVS